MDVQPLSINLRIRLKNMQTLFGEIEDKKEKSLRIVSKGNKVLSKNQQTFNNLTKRIEKLESDIVAENEKLLKMVTFHGKEINPIQKKVADARIQLAIILDKATECNKFSKKQTDNIQGAITGLFEDAFVDIEPTPEQQSIFDKWSEVSYQEEIDEQKSEFKNMFSDMMSDMFGINVDMNEFDESPEEFARFQAKMQEQFEAQQGHHQQGRKKTKKQLAKEESLKAEAEIKNKNIRSIYIALAKVLHPDTDPDIAQKAEKEEIMKKVTVAYEQRDLPTLLKLEMEWVHKTTEHLEKLTDDKLKIYISALKQQAAELEREKFSIHHNPLYIKIMAYAHMPEKYALYQLAQQKNEFKSMLHDLNHFITEFKKPNTKKQIVEFAQQFCNEVAENDFDFLSEMLVKHRY